VTPSRAGRREWIGLSVLALPGLLISLDFSVLTLAVPRLSADLHPSGPQLLWIVDMYGFTLAGFLVTMGTVGDRIGRRRLLLIGAAAFGVASVVAAFSPNAAMLIAARAVLGIAGPTLLPSTLSLIGSMFPDERQRTVAIAVWSTSLPVGGAIGPLVGGLLLEWFWWGSAFLVGVPAMAVLLIAGPALLPECSDPDAGRPDLLSVALSLAAVLPIVYAMKQLATAGASPVSVVALAVGVVAAAVFVARQLRLDDPLIDVRLFRSAAFSASLAANLLSFFVLLGALMLFAQYLQLVVGLSPLEAGLWTVPAMAALIVGSLVTPVLTRRWAAGTITTAGLLVASAGFALLTRVRAPHGLSVLVTACVIVCLGLAPVTTLVTNVVLASAPPSKAGAASGLAETSTELGGALGIAVLGTIATAAYRSHINHHIPREVPADSTRAARGTLGGAVDAANQLPASTARALLTAARDAFADGLVLTAVVSGALVIVLAAVMITLPRPSMPIREPRPAGDD
jgi:DHA2 family multidrug resistance protein-like MFS transporter